MSRWLALATAQRRAHAVEQGRRFEAIAYHESAHAITSMHFGLNVEALRVGLDHYGSQCGTCFHVDDLDTLPTFSQLIVFAAGGAAERRLVGDAMFDVDDEARAQGIALDAFRDVRDGAAQLERARCAAGRIVGENWNATATLARALIDAGGRMSHEQIAPLLRGVPRAAPDYVHAPGAPSAPRRSRPGPEFTDTGLLTRSSVGSIGGYVIALAWCQQTRQFVPTYRARDLSF